MRAQRYKAALVCVCLCVCVCVCVCVCLCVLSVLYENLAMDQDPCFVATSELRRPSRGHTHTHTHKSASIFQISTVCSVYVCVCVCVQRLFLFWFFIPPPVRVPGRRATLLSRIMRLATFSTPPRGLGGDLLLIAY